MKLYRLCRSRYRPDDPTGAAKTGGRWNLPGTSALYAASSLSLACLEILVHIRSTGLVPLDYVYTEIEVPRILVSSSDFHKGLETQQAGSIFLEQSLRPNTLTGVACVLEVPSVIIPSEKIYVLNPHGWTYRWIRWSAAKAFHLDHRLIPSTRSRPVE